MSATTQTTSGLVLGAVALGLLLLVAFAPWILARLARALRRDPVAEMLDRQGAPRCIAALEVLRLAARQDVPTMERIWDRIEQPLLEALPDCPPALRPLLDEALLNLHESTTRRDLQRRIADCRRAC